MLSGVSETLFIPLAGKARVSRYGDILWDEKAREIVERVGYDFRRNKNSRFLDIYMGIRAAILDRCAEGFLALHPDGMVLHLGCGLDARCLRVKHQAALWVDLDLPPVIEARRRFYPERPGYRMVSADVTDLCWLDKLDIAPETPVFVVAEGLTMYLTEEENAALFRAFSRRFHYTEYVFDAYSRSAVSWSKWKNPVNKMGAVIRWGLDEPERMEALAPGTRHLETLYFTGREWSGRLLRRWDRFWFRALYGTAWANSLYRIYRFQIKASGW